MCGIGGFPRLARAALEDHSRENRAARYRDSLLAYIEAIRAVDPDIVFIVDLKMGDRIQEMVLSDPEIRRGVRYVADHLYAPMDVSKQQFEREKMLPMGSTVTPEWPIAFARPGCSADEFPGGFPCNHIHGCYGDWTEELFHIANLLGIEVEVF